MQWTYILDQSWLLPVLVGIGAFLLGVLIPRKSGTNFLASFLFWPVALLRDLLDAAHTKRLQYYALLLALLGMEAFFSVRAATVYFDVLSKRMSAVEVDLVSIIIGCAVFLCGYMVASHGVRHASGKMDWSNVGIAALVVVHDIAGTVWLNYGPGATGGGDWASISITVGMCLFSLVPFALGNRAEKLRPELEAEQEEAVETFTNAATRTIKRRAVDRVLRLANRTDVIHLVRSLPAGEFADFKSFVMPIIAPGISYNLPDLGEQPDKMTDASLPIVDQETGQSGNLTPGQNGESSPDKKANENRQNGSPATGQNGNIPTGKMAGSQPAKTEKNGNQEPSSKTAIRDEKIRQHAAKYPKMTHAKLATKFNVSERTIARALASNMAAMSEKQEPAALLESAEEKPATNGHSKERNTDEMEALVVTEGELVATMN